MPDEPTPYVIASREDAWRALYEAQRAETERLSAEVGRLRAQLEQRPDPATLPADTLAHLAATARDRERRQAEERTARAGDLLNRPTIGAIRAGRSAAPADPPATPVAVHVVENYVTACETHLWDPDGRVYRRWLEARGLTEDVLRANRVGADPGSQRMPRSPDAPQGGPGLVFPALDGRGDAMWCQKRLLMVHDGQKYLTPDPAVAPRPELAPAVPFGDEPAPGIAVVIVDSPIDALTVAQTGRHACYIPHHTHDGDTARQVVDRYGDDANYIVALGANRAGPLAGRFADNLAGQLDGGTVTVWDLADAGDINQWALNTDSLQIDRQLTAAINPAPQPTLEPAGPAR